MLRLKYLESSKIPLFLSSPRSVSNFCWLYSNFSRIRLVFSYLPRSSLCHQHHWPLYRLQHSIPAFTFAIHRLSPTWQPENTFNMYSHVIFQLNTNGFSSQNGSQYPCRGLKSPMTSLFLGLTLTLHYFFPIFIQSFDCFWNITVVL